MSNILFYGPIIIVILIALFSTISTYGKSKNLYKKYKQAPFAPPSWVFGPIWTIIYILIAISWVRSISYSPNHKIGNLINWLFTLNLILNLSWSLVAFGDDNLLIALFIFVPLIATTCYLIIVINYDLISLIFIIIYLIWLVFAFILNFYIVLKNDLYL